MFLTYLYINWRNYAMKFRKFSKSAILLIASGAIFGAGGDAFAQLTIPDLYMQTSVSSTSGTTFKLGVAGTPNTIKKVAFSGISSSKTSGIRVNSCGFGKISNVQSLTSGVVNTPSGSFNAATVAGSTPILEPTCTNGVLSSELPTTGNAFNLGKGTVLVKGLTANTVQDFTYTTTAPQNRNVTINSCGFGVVTIPDSASSATIEGSSAVSLASLQRANLTCTGGDLYASPLIASVTNQLSIPAIADVSRAETSVFIKTTPFNIIPVTITGAASSKSVTSDRCSGLLIGSDTNPISGTVKINGVSVDTSTLPIGTIRACGQYTEGGDTGYAYATGNINSPWDANLASFRTGTGRVFIRNYPGLTIGSRSILTLETTGDRNVSLTANKCGIATLRSSTSYPLTESSTFTYSGTTQTIASIDNGAAPRCTSAGLTYKVN
jgi:hypothetical protein